MERFKKVLPGIAKIEPLNGEDEAICWKAYDDAGTLLGYAFVMDIPESLPDIPGMDEMDKYIVTGVIDPAEYKMAAIDISLHPDGPPEPWDIRITEPDFEGQYIGLTVEEIELSPDGKIDALTDASMSSTWITDAVRERVREIVSKAQAAS